MKWLLIVGCCSWFINIFISLNLITLKILSLDEWFDSLLDHDGLRIEHSDLPYNCAHQFIMSLHFSWFHDPYTCCIDYHCPLLLYLIVNLSHVSLGISRHFANCMLRNQILFDVCWLEIFIKPKDFVWIIKLWYFWSSFRNDFWLGIAKTNDWLSK